MIYCADFETTSLTNYERDGYVRVWLWSLVSANYIGEQTEYYGFTLESFLDKIVEINPDVVYFHNLRFDGQFIMAYLVENNYVFGEDYKVLLDDMGNWYQIELINGDDKIKIWDSLKKYPNQTVNDIAHLYGIEGKKEKPYFDLYRPEGYIPTPEEIEYCLQDSRIVAHAIYSDIKRGHTKMTLASDAFEEVRKAVGGYGAFKRMFPVLSEYEYEMCSASYKGGYVYVNPKFQEKQIDGCIVLDINSMFPDKMRNYPLPFGNPVNRKPRGDELYICRFEAEFDLKDGYLPTVQVKNMPGIYSPTQYITHTTEIPTLVMTSIDFKLFQEHYDINYMSEPEYLCFRSKVGVLKDYIDKYMTMKEEATHTGDKAERFIAKRYMNSPYGKFGTRRDRINKIPIGLNPYGTVMYEREKVTANTVYVPYASFVTAWARDNIIRDAQKMYDRFIYADTDSLHLEGYDIPEGLWIDDAKLGAWKIEGKFELGKYLRPKTYIHGHYRQTVRGENDRTGMGIESAENSIVVDEIKCAGMPDAVKDCCGWENFRIGATFDTGKLTQVRVKGGVMLEDIPFTIKENVLRYG